MIRVVPCPSQNSPFTRRRGGLTPVRWRRGHVPAAVAPGACGHFDVVFDHFSRISQLCTAQQRRVTSAPMPVGCRLVLEIQWHVRFPISGRVVGMRSAPGPRGICAARAQRIFGFSADRVDRKQRPRRGPVRGVGAAAVDTAGHPTDRCLDQPAGKPSHQRPVHQLVVAVARVPL